MNQVSGLGNGSVAVPTGVDRTTPIKPSDTPTVSLKDKIAARKRSQLTAPGPERSAPPIRRLGNDFARVLPGFAREVIAIDPTQFGGEGIYAVSSDVADYFVRHGREKLLFDASIHVAIDGDSQVFLTFAKLDPTNAASSYADALMAAETDWVWVVWTGGRGGYYRHGSPPEPKAPPTWPTDRKPEDIYDAVMTERLITSTDHWLIQRVILGR